MQHYFLKIYSNQTEPNHQTDIHGASGRPLEAVQLDEQFCSGHESVPALRHAGLLSGSGRVSLESVPRKCVYVLLLRIVQEVAAVITVSRTATQNY